MKLLCIYIALFSYFISDVLLDGCIHSACSFLDFYHVDHVFHLYAHSILSSAVLSSIIHMGSLVHPVKFSHYCRTIEELSSANKAKAQKSTINVAAKNPVVTEIFDKCSLWHI